MHLRNCIPAMLISSLLWFSPNAVSPQQSHPGARNDLPTDLGRAKEIYTRDCLVCHGANGSGKTDILRDRQLNLPDWTDPKSLDGRTDQQLFSVIRLGKGKMPAESAGRADDGEVRWLVQYIRTMARNEANLTPAPSADAKK